MTEEKHVIIRAPCYRQDTPLWFWEVWVVGPFILPDDMTLTTWDPYSR